MEQIISKEELDEIKKIKGEITGDCIMNDFDFILKQKGGDGLKKIEDAMAGAGYPIKRKDIKLTELYPVGADIVLVVSVGKIFNYGEKEFEKMGRTQAKISSKIIRTFMRYFISIDRVAKEGQRMWNQHYKFGEVRLPEYDEKKKYAILRIENFRTHPFICPIFKGYFADILEIIIGKDVSCEETKCVHRGDEYHEFIFKW